MRAYVIAKGGIRYLRKQPPYIVRHYDAKQHPIPNAHHDVVRKREKKHKTPPKPISPA